MMKGKYKHLILMLTVSSAIFMGNARAQNPQTYAERLGWQKDDRVVIFHVDDAGMSYASNEGAKQAIEKGVATSLSVMMPCSWTPAMVKYLNQHPQVDAGLHLTHTSEWESYRWGPVSGIAASPGLVDPEGALWNNVADVLRHATADEVEAEIMAQLEKARNMGFNPTHLDTHMGTLWASPDYLERYIKVGVREHIPVLFAAGHLTIMQQTLQEGPLAGLRLLAKEPASGGNTEILLDSLQKIGERIWQAGLPVVDDLHILSYDWAFPADVAPSDEQLRKFKTEKYKELLASLKPGITVILIHCTDAKEDFQQISDSGITRRADLLSMTDPALKKFMKEEAIISTNWRELQVRRDKQLRKSEKE